MSKLMLIHDEDKLHYIEHSCRFYGINYEYPEEQTLPKNEVLDTSLQLIDAEIRRVHEEDKPKAGRPKGAKDSKPRDKTNYAKKQRVIL